MDQNGRNGLMRTNRSGRNKMIAICVNDLVKKYKSGVQALNGLTLTVKEGEIFSLLGQNGAGKSTLINVLTTYLRPTSGNVTMFGKDVYREAAEIRSKISCVAQRTSIDTQSPKARPS